jgi:hypothetical protein
VGPAGAALRGGPGRRCDLHGRGGGRGAGPRPPRRRPRPRRRLRHRPDDPRLRPSRPARRRPGPLAGVLAASRRHPRRHRPPRARGHDRPPLRRQRLRQGAVRQRPPAPPQPGPAQGLRARVGAGGTPRQPRGGHRPRLVDPQAACRVGQGGNGRRLLGGRPLHLPPGPPRVPRPARGRTARPAGPGRRPSAAILLEALVAVALPGAPAEPHGGQRLLGPHAGGCRREGGRRSRQVLFPRSPSTKEPLCDTSLTPSRAPGEA